MTMPLDGIRVLEFTHAVMGPSAGLILADLGAEVIRIEPPGGDPTRHLKGMGTGYFPFYNRNKKSVVLDLKSPEGLDSAKSLIECSDIMIENFAPGTIDRLGLGYDQLKKSNPRLIYCSLKGFLPGPYEKRLAMDEVVQMMSGLAYMTGPRDQPLRAGTSIIDITGGMFGVIGILSALYQRQRTQQGSIVKTALFETAAFTMGQHMAYAAKSQEPVPPMPERVSAWSVYQIFKAKNNEPIFLGIISDQQWHRFVEAFDLKPFKNRPDLATNNRRIDAAEEVIAEITRTLQDLDRDDICRRAQAAGIPYAKVSTPEDLFDDPQMTQNDSLLASEITGKGETYLPNLPLEINGERPQLRRNPPQVGQNNGDYFSPTKPQEYFPESRSIH